MGFLFIIAAPVLFALIIAGLRERLQPHQQGWLLASGMAGLFLWLLLGAMPGISADGAEVVTVEWMPQIGLTLSLYIDGLALLFGLLVTGIGIVIMLYAGYYFDDVAQSTRFYLFLLGFTSSMLALVLAGNLLTLFIAWELTSVTSFMLISFKGTDPQARSGAAQAMMITVSGGLALLVGLLLVGVVVGSLEFEQILLSGDLLREHPWYVAIAVLVMIGCFSKSAQFPLHFWLPGAMSAPTPASAFLHSATMVKAGVYLLARFYPVLGDTSLWETALVSIGLTTMLVTVTISLQQRDLKGILAYTTTSQLGALVALIGLPGGVGLKAAMIGILAHALYKGTLFLVAGAVDHATGTRYIDNLGGLRGRMPGFAITAALVGLSMAGVPPLFGFVAKETLLEAFIEQPLALAVVVISATLMVTAALRLFWDVFMGAERLGAYGHGHGHGEEDHAHFHALPRFMVAGPGVLAGLSIIAGVGIGPLISPLVGMALGQPTSLYLFPPYINQAFILSMVALVAGTVIFLIRHFWLALPSQTPFTGRQGYLAVVRLVESAGDLLLKSQGGKIRYYLSVILLSVLILISTVLFDNIGSFGNLTIQITTELEILKLVLLGLTLLATLGSILLERHLLAALALGAAGYAVGGLFLVEPAPDVALVQFLVETLATVLIVIILARTSEKERQRAMEKLWGQSRAGIVRDAAIATVMGVAVAIFALAAVSSRPTPDPISQWHLENALPQVGVTDVVAGILTDFRATDTLIEITVFGMAALGVLTMLARPSPGRVMTIWRRRPETAEKKAESAPAAEENGDNGITYQSQFSNPVTRMAATVVMPVALLLAMAHVLYGASAPGDGFTAGVVAGLGVASWFVVFGYEEAKNRLRWLHPAPLIGVGLLLALVNALLPLVFGREFFAFTELTGIEFADIKFASSLVFEFGIFLAVFGGVGTITEAISHPKEVEPL